jgi:hypothetical protein
MSGYLLFMAWGMICYALGWHRRGWFDRLMRDNMEPGP